MTSRQITPSGSCNARMIARKEMTTGLVPLLSEGDTIVNFIKGPLS